MKPHTKPKWIIALYNSHWVITPQIHGLKNFWKVFTWGSGGKISTEGNIKRERWRLIKIKESKLLRASKDRVLRKNLSRKITISTVIKGLWRTGNMINTLNKQVSRKWVQEMNIFLVTLHSRLLFGELYFWWIPMKQLYFMYSETNIYIVYK